MFVTTTLTLVTIICGVFLVSDTEIPEWFPVVGRWLPALVSLGIVAVFGLRGRVCEWWMLRPGGVRRLLTGLTVGMLGLIAVYAAAAAAAIALGVAVPLAAQDYLGIAAVIVPSALLFSLSTLGEEAAWRGFLPQLMPGVDRWTRATLISGVWVLFHIPLHGAMVLQGVLPLVTGIVSTLLLLPLGIFLVMLVERFGSVWPAVIAHAVPMSVLNLVASPSTLTLAHLWMLAGITAMTLVLGALVIAPRRLVS